MTNPIKVVPISSIDWPSSESELPKAKIVCGTISYHWYNARKLNKIPMNYMSQYNNSKDNNNDDDDDSGTKNGNVLSKIRHHKNNKKEKEMNLKTLTPKQLEELSYYQILGNIQMYSTQEQIKKAFHKACLKYHPDKEDSSSNANGNESSEKKKKRGEDPVFLKVKEAFETLSDPKLRKSYDSTVDFDDRIPSVADVRSERDFYVVFGECFERNLRFAAENEPGLDVNGKRGKKKSNGNTKGKSKGPPSIGDSNTSIDDVHQFYDYWVRFESWRDFTLPATKELEHDTDMAECRYEKRWMEKEIARKAKALKRDEMARITKLVDRAMSLDPRLQREKKRVEKEKKEKQRLRKEKQEREERERREKVEREEKERIEQENLEKEERAKLKMQKEQGKKVLRKAKQTFRKIVLEGYEAESTCSKTWDTFDHMNDDLEFLCSWLSLVDLQSLTNDLTKGVETNFNMVVVRDAARKHREVAEIRSKEDKEQRELLRQADAEKEAAKKAASASKPWSKEELSALAKAVKKYPPGGANRWDSIALFINNLLKLVDPRTKEECIEKYNAVASGAVQPSSTETVPQSTSETNSSKDTESIAWSEEQDKQLQEGLAKYPSSMDKNERWTAIAKCVSGKSKKECVQRFKAIREALKKK